MQLHSINQISQSPKPKQHRSVATPPSNERLLILAQIFLRKLRAEIPESENFQVRCAISDRRVMVLVERPEEVNVETDTVVVMLARMLEKHPEYITPQVEFFLRKLGSQRPYAKRIVTFNLPKTDFPDADVLSSASSHFQTDPAVAIAETGVVGSSSLTLRKSGALATIKSVAKSIPPLRMRGEIDGGEHFHRVAKNTPPFSRKQIIIASLIASFAGVLGAGYAISRPCVVGECQALRNAKIFDSQLAQRVGNSRTEADLRQLQTQIDQTKSQLDSIPKWSVRYSQTSELKNKLLSESAAATQTIKGLNRGVTAIQGTRSVTDNINELQTRQQLWRNAIAPLESIRPNSAFYNSAQARLSVYRNGLQAVNVQLLAQGRWQQRLNAARAIAETASQRDSAARTLPEFQQAQANWQTVVNALKDIPPTSPVYLQAQRLLAVYQKRLATIQQRIANEQRSPQLYNQARNAAQLAQAAMQNNQWQQAVSQWQQALNLVQQIPPGSGYHAQAQPLVELYTAALAQARTQIINPGELKTTRSDLEKTCQGNGTRICNFSLANRAITVRMTFSHERKLEANLRTGGRQAQNVAIVTNHLESLQAALSAISDNADLPLFVFDAQGAQIYTHIPRRTAN